VAPIQYGPVDNGTYSNLLCNRLQFSL